jgi:hypothetical protein
MKALLNCVPALDHPHLKARFSCSVWVPADAVGKILNKRGACEQIHHDQHIIRISAPPQEVKFKSLWTEIHLVGDVTAVYKAYRTIATFVDGELDDCVADFPIHHKRYAHSCAAMLSIAIFLCPQQLMHNTCFCELATYCSDFHLAVQTQTWHYSWTPWRCSEAYQC